MRWISIWIRYWAERAVLRGSLSLVLLLIGVQALIAFLGGLIAYLLPGEHFAGLPSALWWATLRMSDTGYLSDDFPDVYIRALSASLSILGMTVTVGGIVAIVTQGMNVGLRRLASASSPVPFRDHFVIIGWSDRTPRILQELLSETKARVVLLLERVGPEEQRRLVRRVIASSHLERIVLRAGSPYRPAELARAACQDARGVILPASARAVAGDPTEGPLTLKCLLALRKLFEQHELDDPPKVVVELVDRRLIQLVESTLPKARVLASDRVVARVMRLALQGRSLVDLALDVARPDRGVRVQARDFEDLVGLDLFTMSESIRGARIMGLLRSQGEDVELVVDEKVTYQEGDRALVLATDAVTIERSTKSAVQEPVRPVSFVESEALRILVLGWNEAAPDLVGELSREPHGRYEVDFLSLTDVDEMAHDIEDLAGESPPVHIRYFRDDPLEVEHNPDIDIGDYDRFVVLANRTVPSEHSDVRSLAVVVELQRLKKELRPGAYVLLELLEQENSDVLSDVESITTPLLAADVLCSLVVSDAAMAALSHTFSNQQAYVTRVIYVPAEEAEDLHRLRRALLVRGLAFLQKLTPAPHDPRCPVLVVEPTRKRHGAKEGAERKHSVQA